MLECIRGLRAEICRGDAEEDAENAVEEVKTQERESAEILGLRSEAYVAIES